MSFAQEEVKRDFIYFQQVKYEPKKEKVTTVFIYIYHCRGAFGTFVMRYNGRIHRTKQFNQFKSGVFVYFDRHSMKTRTAHIEQQFYYSTKKWREYKWNRRGRKPNRFCLFWYFGSFMKCYDETPPTTIPVMWYSIVLPISEFCLWFYDIKTLTFGVQRVLLLSICCSVIRHYRRTSVEYLLVRIGPSDLSGPLSFIRRKTNSIHYKLFLVDAISE